MTEVKTPRAPTKPARSPVRRSSSRRSVSAATEYSTNTNTSNDIKVVTRNDSHASSNDSTMNHISWNSHRSSNSGRIKSVSKSSTTHQPIPDPDFFDPPPPPPPPPPVTPPTNGGDKPEGASHLNMEALNSVWKEDKINLPPVSPRFSTVNTRPKMNVQADIHNERSTRYVFHLLPLGKTRGIVR